MTFDLVTVGSATIDAFLSIHHANVHCRLDEKDCELCIKYGQKIQLDACEFHLGGNACNVAAGASRAGFSSTVVVEIGDDDFGKRILQALAKEHVDTHFIKVGHAPSSFAVAINFKGERTLFVEHIKRKHEFSFADITTCKWMYLTSLGQQWKHVYENALSFVRQNNIHLAFNPGTVQIEEDGQVLQSILKQTDVLFLNKEEALKIANRIHSTGSGSSKSQIVNGREDSSEIRWLLTTLQTMGAKTVVITDGKQGSYVIDQQGSMYACSVIGTPVVEKTGAGDAYASGFLSAILSGADISTAMQWGTVDAASVIGKVGAQPGLLTREEIEKQVNTAKLKVIKIK